MMVSIVAKRATEKVLAFIHSSVVYGLPFIDAERINSTMLNLSTMICFDVTNGMRKHSAERLIVTSNELPLNDENVSLIPPEAKILIHADPKDATVFLEADQTGMNVTTRQFKDRFPGTALLVNRMAFSLDIDNIPNNFRITHWKLP